MEAKILNAIQNGKDDEIHIEDILRNSDDSEVSSADEYADHPPMSMLPDPSGPQTGPKGVLNDYKKFKLKEWRDKQERKKKIISDSKKKAMLLTLDHDNLDDEDDLKDEDDDEFMRKYVEKRLQDIRLSSNTSERKVYGKYQAVNAETYAQDIDDTPTGTRIIVHIYKSPSSLLHKHFKSLARQFGYARFLHLPYSEAPHLDQVALPAVLVYVNGDLQGTILQFVQQLTDIDPISGREYAYSEDDVRRLLVTHGALMEEDYCETEAERPIEIRNDDLSENDSD